MHWLHDLKRLSIEHCRLISDGVLDADTVKELALEQRFERGGLSMLLGRFERAQSLLAHSQAARTHGEVFQHLQPCVAQFYAKMRARYPDSPADVLAVLYSQGLDGDPANALSRTLGGVPIVFSNTQAVLAPSGGGDGGSALDSACAYAVATQELLEAMSFQASFALYSPVTLLELVRLVLAVCQRIPAVLHTAEMFRAIILAGACDSATLQHWTSFVNARVDAAGNTPLITAVALSEQQVATRMQQVAWLLQNGADTDTENHESLTAVELAGMLPELHPLFVTLVAGGGNGGSRCMVLAKTYQRTFPGSAKPATMSLQAAPADTVHGAILRLAKVNSRLGESARLLACAGSGYIERQQLCVASN